MVLRMLILANITFGGIKTKQLENIKREILQVGDFRRCINLNNIETLQAYGYELLPTLLALENLQLIQSSPLPASKANIPSLKLPFATIRKQLRLLIEESEGGSDAAPADISYVYSGYAPLSVRLVQCVAQMNGVLASYGGSLAAGGADKEVAKAKGKGKDKAEGGEIPKMNAHPIIGWKGFEDVINMIPGSTVDIAQKGDGTSAKGPSCGSTDSSLPTRANWIPYQSFPRNNRRLQQSFSQVVVHLRKYQL